MSTTLTGQLSATRSAHTACMRVCASAISWSPRTCILRLSCTLTGCDTAGEGQHRLIRSAPSRPADVAVAQNDLPPSCATGPSPVAHPASRSMTSPAPSVTVMIRPAADETTTRDGRPLAQAGTSHVANRMDRLRMRGKQLPVAAPAEPSGRDGVMASPPPPRRRWLLAGAGAAFQHVVTASTVTYHQSKHCPQTPI